MMAQPPITGSEPIPSARWLQSATLSPARQSVAEILRAAPAFQQLSSDEQKALAHRMVKVASYMVNPDGLAEQQFAKPQGVLKEPGPLSQAQDATEDARRRAAKDPGFAGDDFEASAVRQGVEQFGELVQTVDFPAFVGGLIENVFQAIVDSSIQQMRAYGELLANVAKTVDEFARDNISEANARDWLADSFPDSLTVGAEGDDFASGFAAGDDAKSGDAKGGDGGTGDSEAGADPNAPRLAATGDDVAASLARISEQLQMARPVQDISDANEELRLVLAARLQMARGRQQMLSSMVILGINRIVITDGQINAKIIFGLRASDVATRRATASLYDRQKTVSKARVSARYGGWFSPIKVSTSASTTKEHMATVRSSVDDTSESRAEVKARLSGEVRVNFKSDHFPMEKLASPQMIAAIQGNAEPLEKTVEGA